MLLIPAFVLAVWAQIKVKTTYNKFKKIAAANGLRGAEVAKYILQKNGIYDVEVEPVPGELSDHYDPRVKKVRLSEYNYASNSLAAIAVAAHEVGHAIQHAHGYMPLKLRHAILPVTNFASYAAFPLFFIGFLFNGGILMQLGIIFFAAVVLFHVVTLPVEFNASWRALNQLKSSGLLMGTEVTAARKVLTAAALTYVAAAAMALLELLRLIILANSRD
ncbi:MAG TPA: zinc metallopeptidase [Caldithrix abyssi]|uniref:Zinc metallopeptidase n=1 Tax=Caldithrix abyssi TaxID=187145 RepID=A0A7V5H411_CALAY|nr:zinc metallopeptidase [Caldithrix abyssi]